MLIKRLILVFVTLIGISFANDINLDLLIKEAKKTNKHILVYLHISGCPYCNKMEEFTFDDDVVSATIKKDFIFVDINVKDDGVVSLDDFKGSKMEFAKLTGYNMYPSSLFFDENGELIYDEVGYIDEDKYLKTLQLVNSKDYNNIE
jgi:thioredoxin-related protein